MKIISDEKKKNDYVAMHQLDKYFSKALLDSLQLMEIKAGEYLITQNSQMTHLYCLVEGKLQVERFDTNGHHIVFSFEEAFSVIGDLELFSQHQALTFNAVHAVTNSVLLAVPLNTIKQHAQSDAAFLTFICQQLSLKLYNSSLLRYNSSYSAEFKLKRYLFFKSQQAGLSFKLEKRESISAMLSISTRQLNRAFNLLIKLGIIQLKNKSITILDANQLSDITKS